MVKRIIFFVLLVIFAAAGFYAGLYVLGLGVIPFPAGLPELKFGLLGLGTLVGLVLGLLLAPWIISGALRLIALLEMYLQKTPTQDLVMGSVGLIIGLIIANLLGSILYFLGPLGRLIWILGTVLLGYLGMSIAVKKREELLGLFSNWPRFGKDKAARGEARHTNLKLLDTSVIIDGRIADLCESGFIEGVLVAPNFVLEELRHIADSPDVLKRNRGRRGLDILNKMRKESPVKIQVLDNVRGLEDIAEVDSKLVKLAQRLGAKILTNDFNLNKVAELHGVKVLNINELANAIKPVVLPGEEMTVQVVKDGKEMGQGVAYLDDGTMIVVDGGKRYMGQTVSVLVTSVLQTAAGRMIFAKPKTAERQSGNARYNGVNVIG
ncbi:PIN/TRAM domain-containing protein [Desulfotomaculum copahuensis]|uniref:Twitching motility protein PilT n=1 Tax=Desulfotomaculum copahuensis TaxID=1838280 RepID=A0A1B7LGL1_9FIRM|nr:PIN/TRAM domain-containing protein [Desulfotomaculum copahuensis]OAT85188.1 twitching motility protein PilT [Desulfotomaculum copahuensis]